MLTALRYIIYTELLLRLRRSQHFLLPLMFYSMIILLFPLALSNDVVLLKTIFPGCLWIAAMLASLLAIENVFYSDTEDAHLEQCAMSTIPLFLIMLCKLSVICLTTMLPLLLITPLFALLFHLTLPTICILLLTLVIGVPILIFIGSLGCVLTMHVKQQSVLLSVLMLPLCIPVLIFAVNIVQQHELHLPIAAPLALFLALMLAALLFIPIAIASVIRMTLED